MQLKKAGSSCLLVPQKKQKRVFKKIPLKKRKEEDVDFA